MSNVEWTDFSSFTNMKKSSEIKIPRLRQKGEKFFLTEHDKNLDKTFCWSRPRVDTRQEFMILSQTPFYRCYVLLKLHCNCDWCLGIHCDSKSRMWSFKRFCDIKLRISQSYFYEINCIQCGEMRVLALADTFLGWVCVLPTVWVVRKVKQFGMQSISESQFHISCFIDDHWKPKLNI